MGKQHGCGKYTDVTGEVKYGLWENGKRTMWFDDQTKDKINSGKVDVRTFFSCVDNQ